MGDIKLTAGAVTNGRVANGQELRIAENMALYALLGTTYGGDGVTTFKLPNLTAITPNGMTYYVCTSGVFPRKD